MKNWNFKSYQKQINESQGIVEEKLDKWKSENKRERKKESERERERDREREKERERKRECERYGKNRKSEKLWSGELKLSNEII